VERGLLELAVVGSGRLGGRLLEQLGREDVVGQDLEREYLELT
jgi:hypothetical protein